LSTLHLPLQPFHSKLPVPRYRRTSWNSHRQADASAARCVTKLHKPRWAFTPAIAPIANAPRSARSLSGLPGRARHSAYQARNCNQLQAVSPLGRPKTRWICADCGIGVIGGVKPGTEPLGYIRIVRPGTLDDTSWVRPTTHYWTRSKQPWVILPDGGTVHETQPDRA
jgi:hypothetical protein